MGNIFQNINIGSYQEIELDMKISAFEMFKRLYLHEQYLFLLESLGEEGKYNRFSYVGFSPELIITALSEELFINNRNIKSKNPSATLRVNPFNVLKSFSKFKSMGKDYCGGLVGYFSYEATRYFESSFESRIGADFPDFQFGLYLDGFKFDKKGQKCTYFHHGKSRLLQIMKIINQSDGNLGRLSYKTLREPNKNEHEKKVNKILEEIKKGNIFQAVLSERTDYQLNGDKRRIYAVLRQINPSPYMIYLKHDKREIISASPELLIRTKGKRLEHFGTLAGTIKRGTDSKEDEALKLALLNNEKELAEHYMLVDLARNDVGRVAKFGSVKVDKLASVKKFPQVQHLFSEIRGDLTSNKNCFDALSACFPAGTLTGAPKIEAMKIINHLEGRPRGPYGGVAGYFSLNGESMLAIIIRSLFINGNFAYTQTGSGIVLDSIPEKEFQEILSKQKGVDLTLKTAAI